AQVRAAWRSARRLASLVDAVLEFARFEEGAVTPQLAPVDLAQATRRMCGLMSTAFERAGIAFEVDCPPLPELVAVDREMWEKVLSSLLSNALKFTANGAVKVTQHVEDGRVVLTVRDTGAGIDDRVLPQIFDRFFSATPPGAGAQHGAGVGLSLARELVRLHGGDIEVASQVGRGSTVTVQIPYRSAAGAGAAHAYSPDDRCGAADSLSYAPLASDPAALLPAYGQETDRIMVVDDNADTAEYLRELLGRYWPVEVVVQGQRALARAREAAPALILADLVMPGLDGLALVRELRRDARTCQIPVVILSAQADEQTAVEGLHAGAADYIVKPFSGRELVARIEGRLASSRERRGDRVARQSAELELKLRDEFIATMSHELRAPLSAILGWAEILRDQDSSEERRAKALEVIQRNAKAQTRLIADLLDVSRIATGSFRVELEALETVGPMVQSAVESLLPSAQRAGIVMSASVDEPAGPVFADAQRLQQVVWNLVANALKFTPREGSIQVLCGVVDGALRIRVVDTGQGIGHEFLPHVFERFAQERRADAKHGLGLGLAIVHGILERHDGTISVESEGEGRGTAFTVWLPLRKS
ncbi:MAG TPA: ATP-binding protein, partial [Polyangiaceae bacterium]|nr:ATP-binding protein [Polyangiaceae bacterium]